MPLLSLFITLVAFAISGNAVAPLISTLSANLGVQASLFGFFIALQFLAFSAASFLGGFLKERLRLTNYHLIAAGLLLISLAFFLGAIGLRSTAAIIIWVIPLGLAGGSVETFSSIQISNLSRKGSSKSLSLSQVFYSIGAFAAPQIVYLIFGAGLDWRSAFVIFGLFSTAVFVFFLTYNGRAGNFSVRDAPRAPRSDAAGSRTPVFFLILLLMLACVLTESLSAAWLSYVFEIRAGLTPKDASLVLVIFWLGMMAGRAIVVVLPTRWTLWPTLIASSIALVATTACLAVVTTLPAQYVCVGLLGVFLGPLWPVIVMTSSSTFQSEKLTSVIIGTGAIGFGSGPLLGSLIVSRQWTSHFFLAHLGLSVLILVFCLASWRLRPRAPVTQ
jgi:fucose permease